MNRSSSEYALTGAVGNAVFLGERPAPPPGKEYDDKGRLVTVGKAREAGFYQLDLAALDLDTGKKKKTTGLANLGSSLKGIVKPKRSPSDASLADSSEELEFVDTSSWPTVKRTKLEWSELNTKYLVEENNLKMIDQSILPSGFHIEFGDPTLTSLPTTLALDHDKEYFPYYAQTLHPVDHANYIAFDDESDMYWIVSIEEKPKNKRQDYLRALVRNRKDYIRLNVEIASLSTSFTDSFTKGSSVRMMALSKQVPELQNLKWIRVKNSELNDELVSMEQKEVVLGTHYKFGVLYVRPNQTEDEIFANTDPSADFTEFLDMMGKKIELFGWDKYRGGLDVKNRSTGEFSYYHEIHGVEVMFHVCTLLPSQENDVQRVERKRHIGNDVVTFIYLEQGCEPYLATKLTSQFIHIHYVVQKVKDSNPTQYRVSVVTKYGVEPHSPPLAHPAIFPKSEALRDFLLTKAINSERTAMLATEFRSKMLRARKDFLKHLYETYSTKKKSRGSTNPGGH